MPANTIRRMVFKNVSFGLSDYTPKTLWVEDELDYNSEDDDTQEPLDPESWQDWHSEELLDDYLLIANKFESVYRRAPFTFNAYCEYAYNNS